MALRRKFKVSGLSLVWFLLVTTLAIQASIAAAGAPAYTGAAVIDNAQLYAATSLRAASTVAGNYQFAFVDYAGTGNYLGAPSGWRQVCVAKGAASIAAFVHLNGASEPAHSAVCLSSMAAAWRVF